MKKSTLKRELTIEIKKIEEHINNMLSARKNDSNMWYYMGDIITMTTINNLKKEIEALKQQRNQII